MKYERITFYFTCGIAILSASIYCFTVGYLDYFRVPEYPSLFNCYGFFFTTAVSRSLRMFSDFSSVESPFIFVVSLVSSFISVYGALEVELFERLKKKSQTLKDGSIKNPLIIYKFFLFFFIVTVLFLIFLFCKEVLIIFIPIIIVPLVLIFYGERVIKLFEESLEGNPNPLNSDLIVFLLLILFLWIFPYKNGNFVASTLDPLKSFPAAWSGGPYGSSDLLVWKESDRGYWINCEESLIYGITNEGHIFYSRTFPMSDKINCK